MQRTAIEWTDLTANPLKYRRKSDGKIVWGCVKESSGCAHCYSEALALRYNRGKLFTAANLEELEPFLDEGELHEMLNRKVCGFKAVSGSRCFVGDMTDLLGEWVPDELLDRLFAVLAMRSDVTWQILTKRAERMRDYFRMVQDDDKDLQRFANCAPELAGSPCASGIFDEIEWPFPNLWLGVSVENQEQADKRIPLLLQTPAAVRFLSCEPLLGPVDFSKWIGCDCPRDYPPPNGPHNRWCQAARDSYLPRILWLIIGGESGHGARPCCVDWIRSIVQQCRAADVACFVKQFGSHPRSLTGTGVAEVHVLHDRKGGDPAEWPIDLRVRQFPEVSR